MDLVRGWALIRLDAGWDDEDNVQKAIQHVIRVYLDEDAARTERERLQAENTSDDVLYFLQETEVERITVPSRPAKPSSWRGPRRSPEDARTHQTSRPRTISPQR
jgi:hypothetical protein